MAARAGKFGFHESVAGAGAAPARPGMKRAGLLSSLVFGWVFSLHASAAEPRIGHFTRYDAGEFVIVTSRSAAQAKHIVEDLGKFRRTLERTLGRDATQNSFPTYIVITSTTDWKNWLQPRE